MLLGATEVEISFGRTSHNRRNIQIEGKEQVRHTGRIYWVHLQFCTAVVWSLPPCQGWARSWRKASRRWHGWQAVCSMEQLWDIDNGGCSENFHHYSFFSSSWLGLCSKVTYFAPIVRVTCGSKCGAGWQSTERAHLYRVVSSIISTLRLVLFSRLEQGPINNDDQLWK